MSIAQGASEIATKHKNLTRNSSCANLNVIRRWSWLPIQSVWAYCCGDCELRRRHDSPSIFLMMHPINVLLRSQMSRPISSIRSERMYHVTFRCLTLAEITGVWVQWRHCDDVGERDDAIGDVDRHAVTMTRLRTRCRVLKRTESDWFGFKNVCRDWHTWPSLQYQSG